MAKKALLWHHVAMTYDRDGFHLYHNGSEVPVDALRNLFERAGVAITYAEWVKEPDKRELKVVYVKNPKKKKKRKSNKPKGK